MNEKMKGKLDETSQCEHHSSQFPTQYLVNPKNLCTINNEVSYFGDNNGEGVCSVSPIDDKYRESENMHAISKLRNGKNLVDPYEPIVENNL